MDSRNLIFPMTVGDLVQSATVVACQKRGDGVELHGVELHLLEVMTVRHAGGTMLEIEFRDRVTLERTKIAMKAETEILVSEINRT